MLQAPIRILPWFFLLSTTLCLAQTATKEDAEQFETRIRAITSGPSSADRMSAVAALLDDLEIGFRAEAFEGKDKADRPVTGKNIIVDLGDTKKPQILIGAHFDQVRVGQGAIDNACSCALLLELIERFKAKPLKDHYLRILFFDQEEAGLIGSAAYVEDLKDKQRPTYFLNFDIFGYGDSLWLMANDKSSPMVKAFKKAGSESKFPILVDGKKEYPPGDHLSFVEAGLPTIAIALIDKSEIDSIKSLLQGQRVPPPHILRTIHTPDDTIAKIKATEFQVALPVVERAIRHLDATGHSATGN